MDRSRLVESLSPGRTDVQPATQGSLGVNALVGYLGAFDTERNMVMSLGSAVRGALGRWEPVAIRAYRGAFIDLDALAGAVTRVAPSA